jgi:hypothetical protein
VREHLGDARRHGKAAEEKDSERILLEVAIDLYVIRAAREEADADSKHDRPPDLGKRCGDVHKT